MEAELHNQDESESVRSGSDDDSAAGELQKHFENDLKVKPADKVPFLVNLCFVCIAGFSTDVAPCNHKVFKHSKKNHKLANPLLKAEIKHRDPSCKLSNKTQNDLLEILRVGNSLFGFLFIFGFEKMLTFEELHSSS